MQNAVNIVVSIAAAFAIDWLVCGRIAAIWSKFSYRYRLTIRRIALLALLVFWFVYVVLLRPPQDHRVILLAVVAILALAYFIVALLDVRQQQLPEIPPRYSDTD